MRILRQCKLELRKWSMFTALAILTTLMFLMLGDFLLEGDQLVEHFSQTKLVPSIPDIDSIDPSKFQGHHNTDFVSRKPELKNKSSSTIQSKSVNTETESMAPSKYTAKLISMLRENTDPKVLSVVLHYLGSVQDCPKEAIPLIVALLRDSNPQVRADAASALGRIELLPEEVVPCLSFLLSDPDDIVRAYAANALGRFGESAAGSVPELIQCLKDKDRGVDFEAVNALVRIGPLAIPFLLDELKQTNEGVQSKLAKILGENESKAHLAIPDLKRCFLESDPECQHLFAGALLKIDNKNISFLLNNSLVLSFRSLSACATVLKADDIPEVTKFLSNPNPTIRWTATKLLGCMRTQAAKSITNLKELLRDPQVKVRAEAAWAIGKIGSISHVESEMIFAFKNSAPEVRTAVIAAFGNTKRNSREVFECLIQSIADKNSRVCNSAKTSLIKLGKESVYPLTSALENPSPEIRCQATKILGQLRENGFRVPLEALVDATYDESVEVRKAARDALYSSSSN